MPKLMDNMNEYQITGGSFTFSGARPETLGATEYTLAAIAVDLSGSVDTFKDDLLRMLKESIGACKKSPRSENLMARVTGFNDKVWEIHGFRPVNTIDVNADYKPFYPNGMTALFDGTYDSLGAMFEYGKILTDQDYSVNGILFVITDGMDNRSVYTAKQVAEQVAEVKRNEQLESVITILIGVNITHPDVKVALENFKNEANFDHYIETNQADAATLARLGAFVSKSISSQSQSLGSGASSTVPTF